MMGLIPPPPPIKSEKQKILLEENMLRDSYKALDEELNEMVDFGLDEYNDKQIGDEAELILAQIQGKRNFGATTCRYDFGAGEPEERLEDQMDQWREKLSKWLHSNTELSEDNVNDLDNQELIALSQVLYKHTLSNGEFKKAASAEVISAWFKVKANRSVYKMQENKDHMQDTLKKIEKEWKYRIKEIVNGAGEVTFIPQRRTVWTLGLIWDSGYFVSTIQRAIEIVEKWMCEDIKNKVVIHGVAKKKTKQEKIIEQYIIPGPPRRRPPPPPPPQPKRVIHEGIGSPAISEPEIPEMPEGPPNEIISDLGYDPRLDDPNKGTLTTEHKEKNTVVELKKNLLD